MKKIIDFHVRMYVETSNINHVVVAGLIARGVFPVYYDYLKHCCSLQLSDYLTQQQWKDTIQI